MNLRCTKDIKDAFDKGIENLLYEFKNEINEKESLKSGINYENR